MMHRHITGRAMRLLQPNIDTDQIYPARFLTVTGRDGLGKYAFCDQKENPLYASFFGDKSFEFLLVGENFGCGSSREHAVWTLQDCGVKVILGTSFGKIFEQNALKNGLLALSLSPEEHAMLSSLNETVVFQLDLEAQTIVVQSEGIPVIVFEIAAFRKKLLLQGLDELAYLQSFAHKIRAHAEAHPHFIDSSFFTP